MGAPLNTPPEAMDAFSAKIRAVTEPADRLDALAGMEAAARLIVAAELDRISPELTSAVCSKTDEWDAGWWAALEWVGQQLGRCRVCGCSVIQGLWLQHAEWHRDIAEED